MTSPISTRKHGDIIDHPVQQSAGQRAQRGGPPGAGRGDRGGRRPTTASMRAVIACEGQTFFAGADITEFGKPPVDPVAARSRRHDRKLLEAGGRGDPRHRARRRARNRARLPLPGRGADRRSSARPRSSSACCPGPAEPSACRASPGFRWRSKCAPPATRSGAQQAFECGLIDRLVEGELIPHAVAFAEEVRDVRPLPKSSERQDHCRSCQRARVRRIPQGQCAQVAAASKRPKRTSRRSRRRPTSPMPRASSTSANCSWS